VNIPELFKCARGVQNLPAWAWLYSVDRAVENRVSFPRLAYDYEAYTRGWESEIAR